MKCHIFYVFLILFYILTASYCFYHEVLKKPNILIGILVRNKAHTLPYTLSFLEKLSYPKDRISLRIISDNNVDNTIEVLNSWLAEQEGNYHAVYTTLDTKSKGFEDEKGIADWSLTRFEHIIKLREQVLNYARKIWADYIFMLDADVFLTNPNTLDLLISKNESIIAPLLKSEAMYSNFWAGMTENYYYKRTDEYLPILNRENNTGCFSVPMVHSAVLIDLRREASDLLTYDSKKCPSYNGPRDDIITFGLCANYSSIPLHICNDKVYGFIMVPLETEDKIENDFMQLTNLKLEILSADDVEFIPLTKSMKRFVSLPNKDKLGLSNVYMINLIRRLERRRRMITCFDELGINAEIVDGVDGRMLNQTILYSWKVKMMPEYKDPYHNRSMTMGEVGCFMSHYIVWNKIVQDKQLHALVLEDDVKFEPYFRQKIKFIMEELERVKPDWDLVYLGRKRMQKDAEDWVEQSKYLVYAGYSYWTVGYLLSNKGAKKLVDAQPFNNLLPVDEFLPIMFDNHPRNEWKKFYKSRNLIALSAEPLMLFPTHYTGDDGYISDTENSIQMMEKTRGDSGSKEEL